MPSPNESNPVNRIAPRFAFEGHIRIRLQRGDRPRVFGGWARDISESGISAFVARELSIGELVRLEVPLDKSIELVISAKSGPEPGHSVQLPVPCSKCRAASADRGRDEGKGRHRGIEPQRIDEAKQEPAPATKREPSLGSGIC